MRFVQRLSYALCMLALVATVSSGQDATEQPAVITGEANITAARIENGNIIIEGTFPDGCTTMGSIDQQIDGDMLIITANTERPADLMCTQAIVSFEQTLPLDLASIPDGEYQVIVNGIAAEGLFNPQAAVTCPAPDVSHDLYTDAQNGLCFLIPADAVITIGETRTTITPPESSGLDPLPLFALEFMDIETPVETYIKEAMRDIFFQQIALDAGILYQANMLLGSTMSRMGFIQAHNKALQLFNSPVQNAPDDALTASDELWSTVTASLSFFTPDPESNAEPTRSTFLEANQFSVTVPVDWVVSKQMDVTNLMPADSTESWMTIQPLPDFPDVDTPDELLVAASNLLGLEETTYETLQNNSTKGVIGFPGPDPACETVFLWHNAGVSRINLNSRACNDDGTRSTVVNTIISAIQVVTPQE